MDKILEALKKTLPADQVKEVAKALEGIIDEARADLEAEFQDKLSEAYQECDEIVANAEAIAEAGYQQAHELISELSYRLDAQKEEYENRIEEEYEEAYAMIEAEQAKNNNLEVELYEEFDGKLRKMLEMIVDKVDQYLEMQNAEIYQQAHNHVINDPRVMEHRTAISKIAEALSGYISEDDLSSVSNVKLEEAHKTIEDLRGHVRVLEEKSFRLARNNENLTEEVRKQRKVLNESVKTERRQTEKKARNVSGRGQRAMENEQIIAEYHNPDAIKKSEEQTVFSENTDQFNEMLVLSGLIQSDE